MAGIIEKTFEIWKCISSVSFAISFYIIQLKVILQKDSRQNNIDPGSSLATSRSEAIARITNDLFHWRVYAAPASIN